MQRRGSLNKRNTRAVSLGTNINNNQDQQNNNTLILNQREKQELKAKSKLVSRLFGHQNQNNMPSVQRPQDPSHLQPNRGLKAKIAIENWQKSDLNNSLQQQQQSNLPRLNLGNSNSNTPMVQQQQYNLQSGYNTNMSQSGKKINFKERSFSLNRPNKINNNQSLNNTNKFIQTQNNSFINQQQNQNFMIDRSNNNNKNNIQNNNNNLSKLNISEIEHVNNQTHNNNINDMSQQEILIQNKTYMQNSSYLNAQKPRFVRSKNNNHTLFANPEKAKPVKHLMDKMIGPIDIRYENMMNGTTSLKNTRKLQSLSSKNNIDNTMNNINNDDNNNNQENPEDLNGISQDHNKAENNSNVNDIDTFISMVREHRLSPMEFIYLIKEKPNSNDAYNMKVYRYDKLAENKIVDYYTLSSKGVTRYENNVPIEFVPLGDWLKERDQFNMIKNLSFFKKFRKWKTLKKWVKVLFKQRSTKIQEKLNEKLYILDPIYQNLLLTHKSLCYDFERLRFVDVGDQQDTMSLEQFKERQTDLRSDIANALQESSKKLHENCQQGIKRIIDQMRQQILNEMSHEEEQMQMTAQPTNDGNGEVGNNVDEKKQILEKLGFPTTMNYGLRSAMRIEFQRFLRLAYLLDFICIQSLENVYIGSAQDFLTKLKEIFECTMFSNVLDNPDQFVQEHDPLIEIQFELCHTNPQYDYEIENQDFDCRELNDIQGNTFDLDMHAEIAPLKEEEEQLEDLEDQDQGNNKENNKDKNQEDLQLLEDKYSLIPDEYYPEETMVKKRNVYNIHDCWLKFAPTQKELFNEIQNIFTEGIDCIQVIERWSKNQMFLPYVKGLEEWDEIIGDKWEKPESYYLNPYHWIKENSFNKEFIPAIKNIMNQQFQRLEQFKEEFQPLLNQLWLEKNSDLKVLENKRLKRQSLIFNWILTEFQENLKVFEQKLLHCCHLGLFKVDCSELKIQLIPEQKEIVENMEKLLIDIYLSRGKTELEWLQQSLKELKGPAINIEEFVNKKENLDKIYKQLPERKEQLDVLESLFHTLNDKQVQEIQANKQIQFMSQQLNKLENDINTEINEVETSQAQNQDRFKKDLGYFINELKEQSNELMDEVRKDKYLNESIPIEEAVEELSKLNEQMKEAEDKMEKYTQYEEILGVQDQASYDVLMDARQEFNLRYDMWRGINEFKDLTRQWNTLPFSEINAKQIGQQTEQYFRIVQKCKKNLQENKVLPMLQEPVIAVKNTMPVVTALRSQYLTDTHWDEIKKILDAEFDIHDIEFTLEKMIALKAAEHSEEIIEISVRAAQEDAIKGQLMELEEQWAEVEVVMKPYKDRQDLAVLAEVDDLIQLFDEGLAILNTLLANRFVRPLRPRALKIQSELLLLQDIIDKWVECQKKWMYLENIFASADIVRSLPQEAALFATCDKFLKNLMRKTEQHPKIMRLVQKNKNNMDNLNKTSENLDIIERQLEDFLETKRMAFPRFYFLSNDELLEILAKSSRLNEVEPSLGKCFEGLVKLHMGDKENTTQNSTVIQGMISPEGEVVSFINKNVKAQGNVELWLDQLQKEMYDCIKKLIRTGFSDSSDEKKYKTRLEWIFGHKGQVVSTVNQINWSLFTEDAINQIQDNPSALSDHLDTSVIQLNILTGTVRGELTSLTRKIIVALITVDVHNRDIVSKLDEEEVESLSDFLWQQQLRYYLTEDDCVIRQVTSQLSYGNEYLGATSRLVITPLTDRCWITITSAVANQLGANPAGPAGTGKTESTKDLAKGLGRLCIVFNCSDQITAAMMNKLFSGLCQQGAWTCLDEFNRIDIEVLSVIAQQLLVIRMALLNKVDTFDFEGQNIPLKPGYGVFITMNPGYAGRTELPDNLKALFRPVAMMIPDYSMIAEIMLYAEGFEDASTLSKKMVQLYKLSSEQLSQQDHYDFGMRAVKSLLVMAGSLKRADPNLSEDAVLIRAMRDANVPKFLRDDLPLFSALVQDLFPSVEIPEVKYGVLEDQIQKSLSKYQLQQKSEFILKVIQLYDTLNVRFGVMLVGPSGTGKTQCYKILAHTLIQLWMKEKEKIELNKQITNQKEKHKIDERYQNVEYHVLNPKSISMGELYGEVDPFTQEWVDGLASSVIRGVNNIRLESDFDIKKKEWVVFDGPVDALWIENMNTVLDDNQTLCLANSERIKLREALRMLFEVQDLAVASPATVSRCGMVYLCHEDLGWVPYVQTWFQQHCTDNLNNNESQLQQSQNQQLNNQQQQLQQQIYLPIELQQYILNAFLNTFEVISQRFKKFTEPFPTTQIQQAGNICNFLYILLKKFKLDKNMEENKKKLNHIFCYAFIWGSSAGIDQSCYPQLDITFKDIFQNVRFPKGETIFDFFVDPVSQKVFMDWSNKLEEFKYNKEANYFDLLVPTTDTTKYSNALDQLLDIQKPCLFTGGTGVGKSVIIKNLLQQLKESKNTNPVFLNFSAQTKSKQSQFAIESKLQKKGKTLFGARPNERIVIFIDDINMPALEEYGAQPCIELLRQFVDKGGLYDRHKLFWKQIEDTTLVCAGAPAGGGRNQLTPRFVRHFHVFCLPQPSNSILQKIFGSICKEFMNSTNFNDSTKRMVDAAVQGTIEVYDTISNELLPIPNKFHYTFNLRDISKVFQGILMIKPQQCQSGEMFTKLWIHETSRVFGDRLVNEEDKEWFQELISNIVGRIFSLGWTKEDIFKAPILFSDITKLDMGMNVYEEIQEKKLLKTLDEKQIDYNFESEDKMDLVFFQQAQEHIVRIARVLRQPRGSAMLIGVGGSGKQSLSKLASFIMKCEVFQIEMVKNYNSQSFRDDLIKITQKTGVECKKLTFIFTDVQISYESFLEDINNLLNTGEVPNLFAKKEDLDEIYNGIRPLAIKLKRSDDPESLWNFFVDNVRENLHIILCMSPVGSALRIRTRKFPSLINCCTLDWFSDWPKEALYSVALKFLDNIEFPEEYIKENLAQMCMNVAVDVSDSCDQFYNELKRKVYTTPKSYLDHISLYSKLLELKRNEVQGLQKKLSDGIDKLKQSSEIVSSLKEEMTALQPELEESSQKTELALQKLAVDTKEANEVEKVVAEEAAKVNQQADEIQVIADEAQQELNVALPALKDAENALNTINKADIAQIKGFNNPPAAVQMVLEAVCALLGEKQDWASAKIVMVDVGFIDRLKNYDKDSIPESYLRKLRIHTKKPEFEPSYIGQKSMACKSLCMWCVAIDKYAEVAKIVGPKKKKVAELEQKLNSKRRQLQVKEDELNKVKEKVAKLQADCDETMQKKKSLEDEIEKTKNRLIAAEKLTTLLSDEGVRWEQQIQEISVTVKELVGNVFMSASAMNYCGPFTIKYRENLDKKWLDQLQEYQIPISDSYSLQDTMESAINIRDWQLNGLPSDSFSVDNAVIATKATKWPLMIDPQGEANKWLKKNEGQNNLQICRFSDPHYLKVMQNAITSGYPVLIEEISEFLDPAIDSILARQVIEVDGRKLIRVGDKKVDYDPNFKLYMTSKMANPHYLPEVFIKVTIINFSITFEGLQDQLLGDVMKNEKPEIEQQRDETIVTIATSKRTLKEAQDKILQLLAEATGMILDDQELIQTLEESKFRSQEITKSLEETEVIEREINMSRNLYLPIAIRGTILYFVVSDLAGIDPMYQFSLQYFKKLFRQAMVSCEENNILQERLKLLNENITKVIFNNVCRGLFESHKKLFSFLITSSIKRQSQEISQQAWNLLIRGPGLKKEGQQQQKIDPNPDSKEITEEQWHYITTIAQQIEPLQKLPKWVKENLQQWVLFKDSSDIYNEELPSKIQEIKEYNSFMKLLLIKVFRPEKMLHCFSYYVSEQMGEFYDTIPSVSMQQVYQDSDCKTPIIFILSQGADPTQMLINFSKDQDKDVTANVISLGQGQGEKAEVLLQKAQKSGQWVLLQNCHLCKSWMPNLEKIVEEYNANSESIENPEFRLFLTSMPVDYFPVSVLQNGIKLTTEAPRGIKANLVRSIQDITQEYIDSVQENRDNWVKMLFGLTFFHAVIQERRKFGPLGFNIRYEFNDSDLDISKNTLKMFIDIPKDDQIPFEAMLYMTGHINYGGRVTDDWDRVCLLSILKQFYTPDALEKDYNYSDSGIYYCPQTENLDEFKKYIEGLPNIDDPEIFGMHENANVTFQQQESNKMIETILSIQPRDSSGGGAEGAKSNDDIVIETAVSLQEQLPEILQREEGIVELFEMTELGAYKSLTTVLLQEMEKFNKLLRVVKSSLIELQKAIKGLVVMSQDLDDMYLAFLNNQLPPIWKKVSYASLKPLSSWYQDLLKRIQFMRTWLQNGNPTQYWISGFFFPQGFLTGVLQTHSRKYKIPIDTLSFRFKIMEYDSEFKTQIAPSNGVYITGLFCDGAHWNDKGNCLEDQPLGTLYSAMPTIHFIPEENYQVPEENYLCPLYKTSNRVGVLSTTGQSTNFILAIGIPVKTRPEVWTLRGTALLTQLDN